MQLAVVGTGYVGLVAGAGFADFGNDVACVDVDAGKIARLERGEIPIYEPGLDALIATNAKAGRLRFSTDVAAAIRGAEVVFIAVGTPPAAGRLGRPLRRLRRRRDDRREPRTGFKVVATKSTVPVGTADRIQEIVAASPTHPFGVASNPEFLKEGDAINDFMKPDRVVIGSDNPRAREVLRHLYSPFVRDDRSHPRDGRPLGRAHQVRGERDARDAHLVHERPRASSPRSSAPTSSSCARAWAPTRASAPSSCSPGPGFGGSCFPKDIAALLHTAHDGRATTSPSCAPPRR